MFLRGGRWSGGICMEGDDIKSDHSCSEKGCRPIKVPTDDEVTALNALRVIKKRVREIKKEMSVLLESTHSEAVSNVENRQMHDLKGEMEKLNTEWKEWERKRDEAARERMILLGHIEP
jgi:hypothetical protein